MTFQSLGPQTPQYITAFVTIHWMLCRKLLETVRCCTCENEKLEGLKYDLKEKKDIYNDMKIFLLRVLYHYVMFAIVIATFKWQQKNSKIDFLPPIKL